MAITNSEHNQLIVMLKNPRIFLEDIVVDFELSRDHVIRIGKRAGIDMKARAELSRAYASRKRLVSDIEYNEKRIKGLEKGFRTKKKWS